MKKLLKWLIIGTVALFGGVCLMTAMAVKSASDRSKSEPTMSIEVGKVYRIHDDYNIGAAFAPTEAAYDAYLKAAAAQDTSGMIGTVKIVPNKENATARMLEYGSSAGGSLAKVRLLDGSLVNQAGYVITRALKPSDPERKSN